jgi:GTPase SAR1 family protein
MHSEDRNYPCQDTIKVDDHVSETALDFGQIIKSLKRLIRITNSFGGDFGFYTDRLREIKNSLSGNLLHIGVTGQAKSGKSSLINKIIGEDILPTGIAPTTEIPVFVKYGNRKGVNVHHIKRKNIAVERYDSQENKTLNKILHQFVSVKANPQNVKEIIKVELIHTAPVLKQGLVLIDTPGIHSTFDFTTDAPMGLVSQFDILIHLCSAETQLTEDEIRFLRTASQCAAALFSITKPKNHEDIISNNMLLPRDKIYIQGTESSMMKFILENKEIFLYYSIRMKTDKLIHGLIKRLKGILTSLNTENARFFKIMDDIENNTENY